MSNSLGDREQAVRLLMEGGRYTSEDEVIDVALRLLLECDERAKIEHLRLEIGVGVDQADRGELAPFDARATLARIRS